MRLPAQGKGADWPEMVVILLILGMVLLAGAGWAALRLKSRVCLRRKDCCGRGCGCLFPVRRPGR